MEPRVSPRALRVRLWRFTTSTATGFNDIIHGRGHSYGLFWHEQVVENGKRSWRPHLIDGTYSRVHNTQLADLTGDGKARTNRRNALSRATTATTPVATSRSRSTTTRSTPQQAASLATRSLTTHLRGRERSSWWSTFDKDGDADILTAGKSGQFWFENMSTNNRPRAEREKEFLYNYDWPFKEVGPML